MGTVSGLTRIPDELLQATQLSFSADLADLESCNFYIVTVPTPIDEFKQPDLTPLIKASQSIANAIFTSRCVFSITFAASATLILGALCVPTSIIRL